MKKTAEFQSVKLEALASFLQDIACLDRLKKYTEKVNLFDVLRVSRTEIRHSNFLAWLLDPNANHFLGDKFLRVFFTEILKKNKSPALETCKILSGDFSDFAVKREEAHIDILAYSTSLKIVLCIENKIDACEHDNQLQRYYNYIKSKFKGYKLYCVFLSPDGADVSNESDRDFWLPMDYKVVYSAVAALKDSDETTDDVRFLLNQYYDILTREIMENEEIARICQEIYEKHKMALDLIFENRDDICRQRYDLIVSLCNEAAKEGKISFRAEESNKTYIRFSSQALDAKIFPLLPEGTVSGWNNRHSAYYEIRNREGAFSIALTISAANLPVGLKKRAELIAEKRKDNWSWMSCKPLVSLKFKKDSVEVEEDAIKQSFKECLEKLVKYEKMLIEMIDRSNNRGEP